MAFSKVLTQQLKTRQAIDYLRGFSSNTEKSYFVFIGKPSSWDSDEVPLTFEDTLENRNTTLNDIIMAKQVFAKDASLVIPRIDWTYGTVYNFHDEEIDLFSTNNKFYILTDDFNVYKCISNNGDSQSTVKPTSTTAEEQITSDGYIWKFLYKIREDLYGFMSSAGGKFNSGWMPVEILPDNVPSFDARVLQRNVEIDAVHGQIEEVVVAEIGDVYVDAIVQPPVGTTDSVTDATESIGEEEDIIQENAIAGDTSLKLNINASAKAIKDYYNDYYIVYISSGTGQGQVRIIIDYESDGTVVVDALTKDVLAGSKYELLPRVVIIGNGTGAIVIPSVDYESKYIEGFNVIDPGKNYNFATAKVYQKYSTRESTLADVIIGSPGGHGKYIAWELGASSVMVKGEIEDTLETVNGRRIPMTNYHQVGLLGNPRDNNILTNEESEVILGVDPTPPKRQIKISNEYKTQTIYFNECSCLGTDATEDCFTTSDFIVGDVIKQGPDGSTSQARGIVVSWNITEDTASADFEAGCGCEELGPEGNPINIGVLVVNIVQSEFRGCGTTSFDIVREDWPIYETATTDATDATDNTDVISDYTDSTFPHIITSVLTFGRYTDTTFPIDHYIFGDESKIIGQVESWVPSDSGDDGTLGIQELTSRWGHTDNQWVAPSFDSQGNVVAGEFIHYINSVDPLTGLLDIDNGDEVTSGRIISVKSVQEYTTDLAISGCVILEVEKTTGTLISPPTENPSFAMGETIYQIDTEIASFDPSDPATYSAYGTVAAFRVAGDIGSKGTLELVNTVGTFLESDTETQYALISAEEDFTDIGSGQYVEVVGLEWPEFNKKYGTNLLYIQNVEGVQRANNQIDTIKIVIEF